jgi:hypothetical protein
VFKSRYLRHLFLSGLRAHIFETLGLRAAGFAFGQSILAVAIILSSLMAGLARMAGG